MVGKGGYGTVYKAEDTQRNNALIAIKCINLSHLSSQEIIEATDTYNREVSLLSTLNHANLPHIYDHFTDPEHWYLVMDFIAGETLEDYLHKAKKGYLRVREVLTLGIQLCTVLDYLHTQKPPIIFRDVKPANIMRTPKGHLYLIDFGIARHFTPGQRKDTGPLGSPGYAAPEQYGKAQTTVQTDIYGLGATLQTLLTGADPLETAGGATSFIPPRRIPKKFHQLLNQMREPDASKRPTSMDEVTHRLQQIKWGISRSILPTIPRLLPFSWGLLVGSMPYSLIISFILLVTLLSHYDLAT
jgi:serine/threonine protein kinase